MPSPRLGDIELDLGRYELRRFGRRVKLEKKPMELLILLVRRREQLVSRQDIVATLWHSDLFIDTERNINNIVRKIRQALGDHTASPRFLETVVGKGYRFIGPIRVISPFHPLSDLQIGDAADASVRDRVKWREERCSLAVLPPRLLGDVTDDGGISLGFADALVARLPRLEDIDVLPTSAVFNLSENVSAADIAARLGARFVVHGAIQLARRESRLCVELFDSHTQVSCFTRKFVL